MKLRNKKTGEIEEYDHIIATDGTWISKVSDTFHSIAELLEHYEDYTLQEPLIEDEKIRSVVSKWFDSLEHESVTYRYAEDCLVYNEISGPTDTARSEAKISFNSWSAFENLEDGKSYTRVELCGEEE